MASHECENLINALSEIGKHPELRARFLDMIRDVETSLAQPGLCVRDEITGPIIDALHAEADVLRKTLTSGIKFDFYYRSKIARELVMSPDAVPDHIWEPQTTKLLVHLAADAPHVIIGGAYSGDQAILVARELVPVGGILHAFEPNPDQLEMLRHNAKLNGLDNFTFNQIGLWQDSDTLLKLVGDDSFAHSEVVDGIGDDDAFPTTSINAYGAAEGLDRIGLIMLDIEGAELAALQGASAYLSKPAGVAPVVVFELHRHYVDWSNGLGETDIVKYMTDHGYGVYAVRDFNSNVPMGDSPVELVPIDQVYLEGPAHGFNMLAAKDRDLFNSDFFRICPDVSPKLLWHKDPSLHHPMDMRQARSG